MSVTLVHGDIFASTCRALVNPVNCMGVSGAGLAKAFKSKFPDAQGVYEDTARAGGVEVGHVMACWSIPPSPAAPGSAKLIIFFPTKRDWRKASRIDWIKSGLQSLVGNVVNGGIDSVAIPALGCGLGGLRWLEVRPLIEVAAEQMSQAGIQVEVYAP